MTETIPATDVVRELIAMFGSCPATQRRIHTMILNGEVPATRGPNGRFEISRHDLPAIGKVIGLTESAAA